MAPPVYNHLHVLLCSIIQLMFFTFLYNFAPCLFLALAGMEVAAALADKAHSVSVVGNESVPFKKALGEKVGKAIMKVGMRCGKNKLSEEPHLFL